MYDRKVELSQNMIKYNIQGLVGKTWNATDMVRLEVTFQNKYGGIVGVTTGSRQISCNLSQPPSMIWLSAQKDVVKEANPDRVLSVVAIYTAYDEKALTSAEKNPIMELGLGQKKLSKPDSMQFWGSEIGPKETVFWGQRDGISGDTCKEKGSWIDEKQARKVLSTDHVCLCFVVRHCGLEEFKAGPYETTGKMSPIFWISICLGFLMNFNLQILHSPNASYLINLD